MQIIYVINKLRLRIIRAIPAIVINIYIYTFSFLSFVLLLFVLPKVNTNAELREFCQQVERRCLESIYSWRESLKREKGNQRQFKGGPKIDNKVLSDNSTP